MTVRWLPRALLNLREIHDHIAEHHLEAAEDAVGRIREAVNRLAEYPAMGRTGRVLGTRELMVSGTPYIVPYRVREGEVQIIRVLHAARRWPRDL